MTRRFFAGHGIQIKGKNYLVPVDAQIGSENSVRAEAVDVDAVLDQLSSSRAFKPMRAWAEFGVPGNAPRAIALR